MKRQHVENLNNLNIDLQRQISYLNVENAGLKTENEGLKTANEGLKTENEGLKTENARLKTENARLDNLVKAYKASAESATRDYIEATQLHF